MRHEDPRSAQPDNRGDVELDISSIWRKPDQEKPDPLTRLVGRPAWSRPHARVLGNRNSVPQDLPRIGQLGRASIEPIQLPA
ncbi:hypothetical protein [Nocardia terpenica]|uniref:Uncharacterized protein n=1 Tax=Nocardia terpenica TaxID=455432 RepID=A0A6G9Z731_9NOCA|nr:hypothetical protein [Nocardia terpenica]QIS21302.1 hypothetical protein F6W96_26210 [Nocardia terpenica]